MNRRGQWSTPIQGDPGLPDLLLLRRGQLLVAELKRQTAAAPKDEKARWLSAFEQVAGAKVMVWRPAHWFSGEIVKLLT